MGWLCPEHGREQIHIMILNEDVSPWEFEGIFFSCGRFMAGTINGRHYDGADEFLRAFRELLDEWRRTRELYRFWGFRELESKIARKLGVGKEAKRDGEG